MGRFINPFTDWGFKHIFGQEVHKELLIEFLNDLLEGEHVIADLTFKDKEQLPDTKDMRDTIYDVYCETDTGRKIIVEMQNRYQTYFIDRSIYYAARAIDKQAQTGVWNFKLAPVYTVCFMNFKAAENTPKKFRTDVYLADKETGEQFSDSLRMIYLMLPFFKKDAEECETDFERWIYVLKNMSTFERMPFQAQMQVFEKLAAIADKTTLTSKDRDRYDESMKVLWDNIAAHEGSMSIGRAEGRAEGLAEGINLGKRQTAKGMKDNGISYDMIVKITGLSVDEIENL